MKYPIGIQSFEIIRTEGFLYIDKTDLVYKMASEGSYYFLSRPRKLFEIGVNFSSKTRCLDGWKVQER